MKTNFKVLSSKMLSLKLKIFMFSFMVIVYGAPEDGTPLIIFDECAKTNGLKYDFKTFRDFLKDHEIDDIKQRHSEHLPEELSCALRCFLEKMGLIEGGKFNTEKVKADKMMMYKIAPEKIEGYLKCLQDIEVAECADMKKSFECRYI